MNESMDGMTVHRVDRVVESRLVELRDHVALAAENGETVTYGALAERVERAHVALRDTGLRAGDRMLLVG